MRRSDAPKASQVPATRGRPFANGNLGRKPGSKNRTTLVSAALLEGEADGLLRKALALANAGDVVMLKFFLSRMLPRDRLIDLDLPPMNRADDAVAALGRIMSAVADGLISPGEATALATLLDSFRGAIETAELVKRMDLLEARLNGERAA